MRVALIIMIFGIIIPIAQGQVVINEIYYHPDSGHELDEFVELYNPGPVSMEVDHWSLGGDVEFVIPESTIVPAGGFLVLARDTVQFTNTFGAIPVLY